ncbi:tryptophan-rich sensory protein [Salegentibacter chungangensis]|uniref:Tryptophan-rich sensory protein n=1 Tax=Salegentibacter chungangensis TaxID=1335724 RepID=A0ABW3NLB2_9FLAO
MNKKLSILNLCSVILAIAVSYVSQILEINGNTVGSLSAEYENLFTPAGYAFAIWGAIYLGLLAYSVFLVRVAFKNTKEVWIIEKTGPWFLLANLANSAWVFAWLFEITGLSVLIMILILFSLIKVILNTNMERWDAPLKIIAFPWWPVCLYSGWISVALIANIAAYLTKIGWNVVYFNELQWTMLMIVVATVINIAMIYTRNMREFAAVGIWALVAIYFRHFDELPVLSYTALIGAVAILSNITYHGWKNRKTNPIYRLMNKEKV